MMLLLGAPDLISRAPLPIVSSHNKLIPSPRLGTCPAAKQTVSLGRPATRYTQTVSRSDSETEYVCAYIPLEASTPPPIAAAGDTRDSRRPLVSVGERETVRHSGKDPWARVPRPCPYHLSVYGSREDSETRPWGFASALRREEGVGNTAVAEATQDSRNRPTTPNWSERGRPAAAGPTWDQLGRTLRPLGQGRRRTPTGYRLLNMSPPSPPPIPSPLSLLLCGPPQALPNIFAIRHSPPLSPFIPLLSPPSSIFALPSPFIKSSHPHIPFLPSSKPPFSPPIPPLSTPIPPLSLPSPPFSLPPVPPLSYSSSLLPSPTPRSPSSCHRRAAGATRQSPSPPHHLNDAINSASTTRQGLQKALHMTRAGARHSPRGGGGEAGQAGQQHVQRRRGPAGVERRLDTGGGVERQPRPRGRLAAPLGPAPAAEAARVAARAGGVAAVAGTHVEGPRGARGAGWRRRVLVLARAVDGRRAVQVSGWGGGRAGRTPRAGLVGGPPTRSAVGIILPTHFTRTLSLDQHWLTVSKLFSGSKLSGEKISASHKRTFCRSDFRLLKTPRWSLAAAAGGTAGRAGPARASPHALSLIPAYFEQLEPNPFPNDSRRERSRGTEEKAKSTLTPRGPRAFPGGDLPPRVQR
ncbi:hypothetical protein C7M84_019405 [Penaeus vannamei]|uniref:Uncharacterized protein n=1 Tax=Penaeus vannamei TaxID=6689 RepID=A0A423SET8_PENVA|nr:hypothetical protein C7M84_019405 [Penaeus vannamei]